MAIFKPFNILIISILQSVGVPLEDFQNEGDTPLPIGKIWAAYTPGDVFWTVSWLHISSSCSVSDCC